MKPPGRCARRAPAIAAAALALLMTLGALASHPTNSQTAGCPLPPGATGANGTCFDCHQDWGTAPRDGGLRIEGVPETFEPRHEYPVRVVVTRGTGPWPYYAFSYAFELRATGGALEVVDPGTTVARGPLEVASIAVSNVTEWHLVWTAPETSDDVRFFAGAVVGNGDGTASGDLPYMAWARAYGPLDVPPEDDHGPVTGTVGILAIIVLGLVIVACLLVFPPKDREMTMPPDDDMVEAGHGLR